MLYAVVFLSRVASHLQPDPCLCIELLILRSRLISPSVVIPTPIELLPCVDYARELLVDNPLRSTWATPNVFVVKKQAVRWSVL